MSPIGGTMESVLSMEVNAMFRVTFLVAACLCTTHGVLAQESVSPEKIAKIKKILAEPDVCDCPVCVNENAQEQLFELSTELYKLALSDGDPTKRMLQVHKALLDVRAALRASHEKLAPVFRDSEGGRKKGKRKRALESSEPSNAQLLIDAPKRRHYQFSWIHRGVQVAALDANE